MSSSRLTVASSPGDDAETRKLLRLALTRVSEQHTALTAAKEDRKHMTKELNRAQEKIKRLVSIGAAVSCFYVKHCIPSVCR